MDIQKAIMMNEKDNVATRVRTSTILSSLS